jgi:hypothetical protein
MKSERRQIGGRYLARARGAFRRPDVRASQLGRPTGQHAGVRRDPGHTDARVAEHVSLAPMLASISAKFPSKTSCVPESYPN